MGVRHNESLSDTLSGTCKTFILGVHSTVYRRWVNRRTALRLLESSANFTNPMLFYVNPCSYIDFLISLANSFSLFVSVLAIIFVEIVL
jgi:hypothetical protein